MFAVRTLRRMPSCAPSCTRRHAIVDDPAAARARGDRDRAACPRDADEREITAILRCTVDDRDAACADGAWMYVRSTRCASDEHIRLDAAVCRGCGLCTGVCPTGALITHQKAEALPPHSIVFACQRRTGSLAGANVVRLRCVGELHAGMLLESDGPIRVAGCAEERCRFTKGAAHAIEAVERARAMGADILDDWSPDRLHDPLDEPWRDL
jgi:Pyruvate/2-oxoacid:ferredoxin oxidoreductase delta subunit